MPPHQPSISVVIPVFNNQPGLDAAVKSVLEQTLAPLEIIVVDDGSITPAVVSDGVKLIRHENNLGAAAARNTGLRAAEGSLVAFLDSDDTWSSEKLERQLAAYVARRARLDPGRPLALATGFWLSGGRAVDVTGSQNLVPVPADNADMFSKGCWHCPGSTLMIERTVFETAGFFREDLKRLEDYEFFLRFAAGKGVLETVPEILVTINVNRKPLVETARQAVTAILQEYDAAEGLLTAGQRRNAKAFLYAEMAAAYRRLGNWPGVAIWLGRSLLARPRLRFHLARFWQ